MKTIILTALGATLFAASAGAVPLAPASVAKQQISIAEQVRLVCNEYGRCYRTRGTRYVRRYYGGDYGVSRRSYGYGDDGYGRSHGYYGGGPGVSFSFGSRSW